MSGMQSTARRPGPVQCDEEDREKREAGDEEEEEVNEEAEGDT